MHEHILLSHPWPLLVADYDWPVADDTLGFPPSVLLTHVLRRGHDGPAAARSTGRRSQGAQQARHQSGTGQLWAARLPLPTPVWQSL